MFVFDNTFLYKKKERKTERERELTEWVCEKREKATGRERGKATGERDMNPPEKKALKEKK
jgi:hypothetical protein